MREYAASPDAMRVALGTAGAAGRSEPAATRVKALVRDYWDQRAPYFDLGDSFVARNAAIQTAWREVFAEILGSTPRDVLDVGSGTGELALLFHALGHRPRGVDLAPRMLSIARAKVAERGLAIAFDEGDAEDLPFADAAFDVVHARHLVWTLPRPERALSEWVRVLRPGGRILISESFRDGGGDDVWTRLFERSGRALASALRAAGLARAPSMPPKPASYPAKAHLPYHSGLGARRIVPFLESGGLVDARFRDLRWLRDLGHDALPWHRKLEHRRKSVYHVAWATKPA